MHMAFRSQPFDVNAIFNHQVSIMNKTRQEREDEENFDARLACLLPDFPAIWNKLLNSHRIKSRRDNALQQLAAIMETTVVHVEKRYKFLREKFRKEKAKELALSRSGAAGMLYEPWGLMESMHFLDGVQGTRSSASSLAELPIGDVAQASHSLHSVESLKPRPMSNFGRYSWTKKISSLYTRTVEVQGHHRTPPRCTRLLLLPWGKRYRHNQLQSQLDGQLHDQPGGRTTASLERLVTAAEVQVPVPVPVPPRRTTNTAFCEYLGFELDKFDEDVAARLRYDMAVLLFKYQQDN